MRTHRSASLPRRLGLGLVVVAAAAVLTVTFFLVLPMIQAISKPPASDTLVRTVDAAALPPPPPPPEEQPEEEPEEEPPPPELEEEARPLDLSQLELALNPGFGDGWPGGDFQVDLGGITSGGKGPGALIDPDDLDQRPRAILQTNPVMDARLRRRAPATVYVIFIVDEHGRVQTPRVKTSTDPAFERSALAAVKQWKFEPGKRNGQPVRFPMQVPITFPEGRTP